MSDLTCENAISAALDGLRERISTLANRLGSRRRLAETAGLSETQVYRYISGEHVPGLKHVLGMAYAAGVSVEWLATGRGSPEGGSDQARVAELEAELERVRAAAREARDAGMVAMMRELGLEDVGVMARRGRQEGAWQVMRQLADVYPSALAIQDLKARLDNTGVMFAVPDLEADLAILQREGLVQESEGGYRAAGPTTWVRARSLGDTSQAVTEAVRCLVREILPHAERRNGMGFAGTIVVTVPENTGQGFVEKLHRAVTRLCDTGSVPGNADEVSVVYGVAVTRRRSQQGPADAE